MMDGPVESFDGLAAPRMVPIALDGRSPAVEQPELVIFDDLVALSSSSDIGLVLGANDQWERLALYNPEAGDVSYLTADTGRAFHPDWSPDGSQVAYAGNLNLDSVRGQHIWITEADGSAPRELTSDDTYLDEWPRWSADGTRVLFTRLSLEGDRNAASLWLLDLKSGELIQVASLDPPSLSALRSVRMSGGGPYHRQWEQSVDWWRGR
jgi:Tol biopolymer transport system component